MNRCADRNEAGHWVCYAVFALESLCPEPLSMSRKHARDDAGRIHYS